MLTYPRGTKLFRAVVVNDPHGVKAKRIAVEPIEIVASGPERFKAANDKDYVVCQGAWHCNRFFLDTLAATREEAIEKLIAWHRDKAACLRAEAAENEDVAMLAVTFRGEER